MNPQPPNHPFLSFNDILPKIAEEYIGTEQQRRRFTGLGRRWYRFAGITAAEERIRARFARGEDGYESPHKRAGSLFYPELSASLLLVEDWDGPRDEKARQLEPAALARKAAKLIVSLLRFRERTLGDKLQPELEAGRPLDMGRYRHLFSRLMRPSLAGGQAALETIDAAPSDYIIIAIEQLYYKLRVLNSNSILPLAILQNNLAALIADARAQLARPDAGQFPLGTLTALIDKKSLKLLGHLQPQLAPALAALDGALGFFALDLSDAPQSLEDLGRAIQIRNYRNRDYRRSLQVVLSGGGGAGIIVDPNCGIGGTLSARLVSELVRESRALDAESATSPTQAAATPAAVDRLRLDCDLGPHKAQLAAIERQIESHFYEASHRTVFRFDGIGQKQFAEHGVSADGAFHCALHLAFKRSFGKEPYVHNFLNMRSVKWGDIHRYGSTTPEMQRFMRGPSPDTARAALAAHKALIKKMKSADDPIYQLALMLMTMFFHKEIGGFKLILLLLLLFIYIPNFSRRFLRPDVWSSNIPAYPGVALVGRPGVRLGFVGTRALAGHYMFFEDATQICFLTNPGKSSYYGKEPLFAETLGSSLREVLTMLGPRPA